ATAWIHFFTRFIRPSLRVACRRRTLQGHRRADTEKGASPIRVRVMRRMNQAERCDGDGATSGKIVPTMNGSMAEGGRTLRTLMSLLRRGIVDAGDVAEFLRLYASVLGTMGAVIGQHFGFEPWCARVEIDPSWIDFHTTHRDLDPSARFLVAAP